MTTTNLNRNFATKWAPVEPLTENRHIPEATRVIDPRAATVFDRKRLGGDTVAMVAGWESDHAAIFEYQPRTDTHSRIPLPPEAMCIGAGTNRQRERMYPGVGAGAGQVAIAGGTGSGFGSSDLWSTLRSEVFITDGNTQQTRSIDNMKEARLSPMVTFSPDGQYLLVAGGAGAEKSGNRSYPYKQNPLDSVEIYDLENGCWVDVAEKFPGLEKMPAPRVGGSVCWVQDDKGDRIVFAGGTKSVRGQFQTSFPTGEIHTYAAAKGCGGSWTKCQGTARLFPGMAANKLKDGTTQVIIAGGGSGFEPRGGVGIDPQLYSIDILNPHTGDLTAGYNLPRQPAVATSSNRDRSPPRFTEWGGTALAIYGTACSEGHQQQGDNKAASAVTHALTFGFSKSYSGDL